MTFKCLEKFNEQLYKYVPFNQGCLAENLNEKFDGACAVLSAEWLIKRTENFGKFESPVYGAGQANNPYIPHPIVHGDNHRLANGLPYDLFHNIKANSFCIIRSDQNTDDDKIDQLIAQMLNDEYVSGVITSCVMDEKFNQFNHDCGFVKQGNAIAFFDPNHGEVYFDQVDDFKIWFRDEIKEGKLQFLLPSKSHHKVINDFFSRSEQESASLIAKAKETLGDNRFQFFYPGIEQKISEKSAQFANTPIQCFNINMIYWSSTEKPNSFSESIKQIGIWDTTIYSP
jgi:hypothetical protein